MREIKFRGYSREDNQWHYGFVYNYVTCRNGVASEHYAIQLKANKEKLVVDEDMYEVDIDSIGQYTGFKDKNGVEIYEGDIVGVEDDETEYEIIFDDDNGWIAVHEGDMDEVLSLSFMCDECNADVIGNIYEEKLKGEK